MSGTAVVTGAASGIGLAIAEDLLSRNYQVLLCDIHKEKLSAAVERLGPQASKYCGDTSNAHTIANLAQQALFQFGHIDLVFANAGIGAQGALHKASPNLFDTVFNINVKAQWLTAQVFVRHWMETGTGGHVCFTGSEHSLGYQHAGAGLYTASKHAILGLADVWRHELPDSIKLSVLCPGLVDTHFFDASHVPGARAPSEAARSAARKVMAQGMPPAEVAKAAIDGTLRGDFLIVTHRVARDGALQRWEDIEAAYDAQIPDGTDHERYRVTDVIARLSRDRDSGS